MDWYRKSILAPLTRGGNLPFRRLCVEFGADVTTSEMAYARQVRRGSAPELALLRKHELEPCFGVQLATSNPEEGLAAGMIAVERGAEFIDINAGCPIHDVVRRGMGATLLRRPKALAKIVEHLVRQLPVPVTVKIRLGWSEGKENADEMAKILEDAGVAAIGIHGRTREQRYTKAADWETIARLASSCRVPILGNGDILTHYEARSRLEQSGCASVMIGRGALIKPWLFRELANGESMDPTPEEHVAILMRLVGFMREHFGEDDRGRRKAMHFLPWHLSFSCRYRPLPESEFGEQARRHPLIQTRLPAIDRGPLAKLLADSREPTHQQIAGKLWSAGDVGEAVESLAALIGTLPADGTTEMPGFATAHG